MRTGVGFQPAGNPTSRRIDVLLEGKNAVVCGGGGKVGGSDRAFVTTGTVFNITSGTVVD